MQYFATVLVCVFLCSVQGHIKASAGRGALPKYGPL